MGGVVKMDMDLEEGWRLQPLGGDTGKAFMGTKAEKKIFLKQNASPFLAALSVEEITPRLVWTKRMSSGDVVTAQEWLNGRTLSRAEMKSVAVGHLLHRVHHSTLLKEMLHKVGGKVMGPQELLTELVNRLSKTLLGHPLVKKTIELLRNQIDQLDESHYEVCHGDLNHKNWLLSDSGKLYLVDWDSAKFANPALDISMLLCAYVPVSEWRTWLENYSGTKVTGKMAECIIWYSCLDCLNTIQNGYESQRYHMMNKAILLLSEIQNK